MRSNCMTTRNMIPLPMGISKVFDDIFPAVFGNEETPTMTVRPTVDVVEEDDKVLVRADMPGMEKDNIKVTVNEGVLSIEGSRTEQREEKDKSFTRSERFMGSFARSFTLPTWADGSKIAADYTNGVLTVTIPKTEAAKPKQIDVSVS